MKDLIKFLFQKGQHHPRRGSRNFSREGYNLKKNHVFSLYKCVYKHKSNTIYKMYSCFSFFPSVFYLKGCNLNTPASSKFADAFYLFEIFGYDLQMSGCSFLSNISLHSCYPAIQYINSMALFHSLFLLFKNPPPPPPPPPPLPPPPPHTNTPHPPNSSQKPITKQKKKKKTKKHDPHSIQIKIHRVYMVRR